MKNIFKQIPLGLFLILVSAVVIINGCSKEVGGSSSVNPSNSGIWGEFIPIPGISAGVAGDNASEIKTSNEGIYMRVDKASTDNPWIYRLQNGGIPTWTFHEEPSLYFDWDPSNETTESIDHFAIFFSSIDKNGYVNINTGLPALLEEDHPAGFSPLNEMLVDNSSGAYKWAFFGDKVKIQDNTNVGAYNTICTVPNQGGINFAEPDPYDAIIWAASGAQLFKITVNGAITTFDVSAYDDPNMSFHNIDKIRFPYDELHKDVYFRYQNKVFKIADGTTLSLFYTIDNGSNFLGGDFCVDNSFMYATDGTKKSLSLSTETNIIPKQPNTSKQDVLIDYFTKTGAFAVGPIEVSKDPLDSYIYLIANGTKFLRVPKNLK